MTNKLLIDWGNSAIKYLVRATDGTSAHNVVSIPAVRATLEGDDRDQFEAYNDRNILIETEGNSILWGDQAASFNGRVNAQDDKLEVLTDSLCPGFLPTIARSAAYDLSITVPNPKAFERTYDAWLKTAVGPYSFKRNGETLRATINRINILPESKGSFVIAQKEGKASEKGNTQVIDIGAGTAIVSTWDAQGNQVKRVAKEGLGVISLANRITNDPKLTANLSKGGYGVPVASQVMSGIANGSYCYGQTDVSFEAVAKTAFKDWLGPILDLARTQKEHLQGNVGAIVWTGGGSEIIRKFSEKQAPKVLSNPVYANVLGLA